MRMPFRSFVVVLLVIVVAHAAQAADNLTFLY